MKEGDTENSSAGPPLARSPGPPVEATRLWHDPWSSTQPPQPLRRPDSKGARQVEGDPQEELGTGGAPPTGTPELVTTGQLRKKS